MGKNHALLSPSAAHRWLRCTAAPLREERCPDTSSDFAREGTLAHAYAAKALKEADGGADTWSEREEIRELGEYRSPEMEEHVEYYRRLVLGVLEQARSVDPYARLLVEERVSLPGAAGRECFGTADAIVVNDWALEVFDFKYGRGVKVSAK